jgi:hypothetical protein
MNREITPVQRYQIDLTHSHIRDQSAVATVVKVGDKYQQQEKSVYVTGLIAESQGTSQLRIFICGLERNRDVRIFRELMEYFEKNKDACTG